MKVWITLALSCLTLLITGCATKEITYSVNDPNIRSVLIIPAVNETVEPFAGNLLPAPIGYRIAEQGYYVFPVNTVRMVLEHEGLYEPEKIQEVEAMKLAEMFGADTVLYAQVKEWTSSYALLDTYTAITVNYELFSKDGTKLFENEYSARYSPGNNSTSIADIIANMIAAAIERADPSYFMVADQVNSQMVSENFNKGHYLLKSEAQAGSEDTGSF